jgi:hypothetical protein
MVISEEDGLNVLDFEGSNVCVGLGQLEQLVSATQRSAEPVSRIMLNVCALKQESRGQRWKCRGYGTVAVRLERNTASQSLVFDEQQPKA